MNRWRKKMGWILFVVIGILVIGVTQFVSVGGTMFRRNDWRSLGGEYLGIEGVVFQTKKNNCAAAAATMVLAMNGIQTSLDELESGLFLDKEGATMLSLQNVFRRYGVESEGWRINEEELTKRRFPMILFVRGDHFVVADSVDRAERRSVYLRDPSAGRWRVPVSMLNNIWKGETLIISIQ